MNTFTRTGRQLLQLLACWLALALPAALAQEGHPLTGSWSGNRSVDGKNSRILLVVELARDQTLSGYVLEQGKRVPLESVQVDPATWAVNFALGASEGGPRYTVQASFDDMGSATSRKLLGSWSDGKASGDFSVQLN